MTVQARLTVLSDMAHQARLGSRAGTPAAIADQLRAWDMVDIDLKSVFGKNVAALSDREAHSLAETVNDAGISVEAMSTLLFKREVEAGIDGFSVDLDRLSRVLAVAKIIRPRKIRLLGADLARRMTVRHSIHHLMGEAPWLLQCYSQAIARIADAGFEPVIENETNGCIFSTPAEVAAFFNEVEGAGRASFVWDVQNMWEMGTFPTLEVYSSLRDLIGYVHLKGGRMAPGTGVMTWRSSLEEADWPVIEITTAVLADNKNPVICLNPPHGAVAPDSQPGDVTVPDIDFLRRMFPGLIAGRRLQSEALA